jgi:hypothetical protein
MDNSNNTSGPFEVFKKLDSDGIFSKYSPRDKKLKNKQIWSFFIMKYNCVTAWFDQMNDMLLWLSLYSLSYLIYISAQSVIPI